MLVNTNNLLNILIPKDNKVLKEVLKEADVKGTVNKQASNVEDVIKNLFSKLKNNTQNSNDLSILLKNSTVFKDLGKTSTNINSLLDEIKKEPALSKFTKTLEAFNKELKDIDASDIKKSMKNSGIFLESKIEKSLSKNNLNPKLEKILIEIKNLLLSNPKIMKNEASSINEKINYMLSNKNNTIVQLKIDANNISSKIKTLINNPKMSKIVDLSNELTKLSQESSLIQSKQNNSINVNNDKITLNDKITTILNSLKNEIKKENNPLKSELLKNIDNFLEKNLKRTNESIPKSPLNKDILINKEGNITNKSNISEDIKTNTNQKDINITKENLTKKSIDIIKDIISPKDNKTNSINNQKVENFINKDNLKIKLETNVKQENTVETKSTIKTNSLSSNIEIKDKISANINIKDEIKTNKTEILKDEIKNIIKISQKDINNIAVKDISKILINILENESPDATNNIKNLLNKEINLNTFSNLNKINIQNKELITEFKTNINNLKETILSSNMNNKNDFHNILNKISNASNLNQNLDLSKILNTSQSLNNDKNTIDNLINNIKEYINKGAISNDSEILKSIKALENLADKNINISSKDFVNIKEDLKASLLLMKEEINNSSFGKESLKHIDKLLVQIDYHQLLSLSTNSNHIYLPFVWDMLEDGNISMKELKEDKFFCEINLKLKDMGDIKMLLTLYDENKLDLTLYAQKEPFKEFFKNDLSKLKAAINKVSLVANNIRILDLKDEENNNIEQKYEKTKQDISLGLDIRV